MQIKHVVWAAALAFAIGIAVLAYALGGFGRLGARAGLEAATHAIVAFGIGIATQLGLGLAPVVRTRGQWPRAVATILMIPAVVFGFAAYCDVLRNAAEQGAQPIAHPVVFLYLSIVPVYAAVLVWTWRAPSADRRAPPQN